jgi:hypothetical protein
MKTRNRRLGDAILAAEDVLRQWGEIRDLFGTQAGVLAYLAYLEILTTRFLARFRDDSFYLT